MDLMECLEWQLAEKSADLAENPFLPLVRGYATGFYPFGLASGAYALFGFE